MPLDHYETSDVWSKKDRKKIIRRIDRRLGRIELITQFGKFDFKWMKRFFDVDWTADFDTGLAHYMLDENSRHDIDHLSAIYFGASGYKIAPHLASWKELWPYLARS